MNLIPCPYEPLVIQSARTGIWDDPTKAHAVECTNCREAAMIAGLLGNLGRAGEEAHPLPDPEQIWLNSRYYAMQAARERTIRPLLIARRVIQLAVLLIIAGGITWISRTFPALMTDWLPGLRPIPQSWLISSTALVTLLVAFVAAKLVRPIIFED